MSKKGISHSDARKVYETFTAARETMIITEDAWEDLKMRDKNE